MVSAAYDNDPAEHRLFFKDDMGEYLVTIWKDGSAELARREHRYQVWDAPRAGEQR
jgi:hypothetical protein